MGLGTVRKDTLKNLKPEGQTQGQPSQGHRDLVLPGTQDKSQPRFFLLSSHNSFKRYPEDENLWQVEQTLPNLSTLVSECGSLWSQFLRLYINHAHTGLGWALNQWSYPYEGRGQPRVVAHTCNPSYSGG